MKGDFLRDAFMQTSAVPTRKLKNPADGKQSLIILVMLVCDIHMFVLR